MKPDKLAIYVVLSEAKRRARLPSHRRFKNPVWTAVSIMMAEFPSPRDIPEHIKPLAALYRKGFTLDDVEDVCIDLGLADADSYKTLLESRLGQLFDAMIEWDEMGGCTGKCGETSMYIAPLDVPFIDGKLHGTITFDNEEHRFYKGVELPAEKLTADLIDERYDDVSDHALLVECLGLDDYMATSRRVERRDLGDGMTFVFTDRYAFIEDQQTNEIWSAPPELSKVTNDEIVNWYDKAVSH